MKKSILFIFFSSLCIVIFAKQIDESSAKTVGTFFLNSQIKNSDSTIKLLMIYKATEREGLTYNKSANNYFYIFNCSNSKGFVIVSADDIVKPILGYSLSHSFDVTNMPSNLSWWLQNYSEQIQFAIENNLSTSEENLTEWENLLSGKYKNNNSKSSVSPLLQQIEWGQSPFYNELCPIYSGTQHTVTGCVATAMAQIMKYWNYPANGTGITPAYITTTNNYSIPSVNLGSTTYNWALMPNKVTSTNYDVATLMYDCGVSVKMDYGLESGAYVLAVDNPICAQNAYTNYFGYNSATIQGLRRSDYPIAVNWIAVLKNELDNGRPIQYVGYDYSTTPVTGHTWVCDGYNQSDYFHMNWGWNGTNDDYFNINPLSNSNYNDNQGAIIGIMPPPGLCNYSLSQNSDNFSSNGGTGSMNVLTSPNCNWTAISNNTWIHITSGSSGSGNGAVNYTVDPNTTTNILYGSITIAGFTYNITQTGLNCTYSISPIASNTFSSSGGNDNINVSATTNCNWTAISNNTWINITSGSSGSGNGTVSYYVNPNSTSNVQYGSITIAGLTYNIVQTGINCTYNITPTQSNIFNYLGGSGSFSINSNSSCAWSAVSNNSSWLHITSSPIGTGASTISYSVDINLGTSTLTGTISVAGQVFTVTEEGNSINCAVTFIPSGNFPPVEYYQGDYSFVYNINSGCAYSTLSSSPDWLNVTSVLNNVINFHVSANSSYYPRNGFIYMNGANIMITQYGNTVGIYENYQINSISIFPNPANDKLNIDFELTNSQKQILFTLYNSIGQTVLVEKIAHAQSGKVVKTLGIKSLNSGVYQFQITLDDGTCINRKIVIQK